MRRWIRLGIVVVAIAAMVVAIVLLRSSGDETPEETATTTLTTDNPDRVRLLENQRDNLARIEIDRGDDTLAIVPQEPSSENSSVTFVPEYPYDVRWDSTRVNRIVSGVASLSSRRVIGEVDDLSGFGLDNPSAEVTVRTQDGQEQRLIIGGQTPAQDGYYVQKGDDPTVYLVYQTWITPFFSSLDNLRVKSLPAITFESLTGVRVDTLDGQRIVAEQVPEWDQDPEMGFSIFAITSPYKRRFQANTQWFEEMSNQYQNVSLVRYADDDPANLARYGLNPPQARLTVTDEENTLDLLVGNETDGGRFARFADGGSVFVVSNIDPLVSVNPYTVISPFALIINIDLVDRLTVETPGATFVGRIEREEVEGEEDPVETYFLNDVQIDEGLFKDLYQWAIGLRVDGPGATTSTGEPVATITYYLNDGSQPLSVSFVPQNANYLAVVRDGEAEFVVARSQVQRMIGAFQEAVEEL